MSSQELRQAHTPDDFGHFFKRWIRNPLAMGAVAPSGKSLAKLMAKDVGVGSRVIELGAGTGTLTEALLASGVTPENLYVVERERPLVKILERRFSRCHVVAADVLALEREIDVDFKFDFVISGLPLLCFSPDKRYRILRQSLQLLKPHGRLHQFTYGGRCPIDRDLRALLRINSVLLGVAALNLPPAFVYRITQRQPA